MELSSTVRKISERQKKLTDRETFKALATLKNTVTKTSEFSRQWKGSNDVHTVGPVLTSTQNSS